jgi:NTP pyrophosphatase (non-canonical NTP hydrolase)
MLEILKEIQKLSSQEKKNLLERMVKLQEECGELAQEVLIHKKASGSHHKKGQEEGIKKESLDVILVTLSIYFMEGGTTEEFLIHLKEKTLKWKNFQS